MLKTVLTCQPETCTPAQQHHALRLNGYLEQTQDAIFIIGEDAKFRFANRTLISWMSPDATAVGHDILTELMVPSDSNSLFMRKLNIALTGTAVCFECMIHPPHNIPRWLEISLSRTESAGHDIEVIGIARDISERKLEIAQLTHLARHDVLTGFLNRHTFMQELQLLAALPQAKHHALLYIDLEQFKLINENCGHFGGDELLSQLAANIGNMQTPGDIAARAGSDEFALLLWNCPPLEAAEKAAAIRNMITNFRFNWENKRFDIGVSIGIALFEATDVSMDSILGTADFACKIARNKGRNQIHLYSDDEENPHREHESAWISKITEAFENNRFRLFYQNILPLNSEYGCYDHREILLRMEDENGIHVGPSEFIPAAEKYHLMPLIDRWVIRTLFAHNSELWRSTHAFLEANGGGTMPLCCVNLSGTSLNDSYFPEFLKDQIALYQVPPQAVCFEITETVAINNLGNVAALIKEMRTLGFRFALDDFGSGMSSFSYLKSLPVDFLKIDGSLVKNIDLDKTDLCMVEAIQKIAQEMGIKTIGEFAQNPGVIEKLQAIGVNYAQGFGIHQPEHLH